MATFTVSPSSVLFGWRANIVGGLDLTIGNMPQNGLGFIKEGEDASHFTVNHPLPKGGFNIKCDTTNTLNREYTLNLKIYNLDDSEDFVDIEVVQMYQDELWTSETYIEASDYSSGGQNFFINGWGYTVRTSDSWLSTQSSGSNYGDGLDKYYVSWSSNSSLDGRYGEVIVDDMLDSLAITVYQPGTQPNVTVNPSAINFANIGGTQSVDFKFFDGPISVNIPSSAQSWLSFVESSYPSSDTVTLDFTTASNLSDARSAQVVMSGASASYGSCVLNVTQERAGIRVTPSVLDFVSTGGTQTVSFENYPPAGIIVDSDLVWCSAFVDGTVTASANTSAQDRTGIISFVEFNNPSNYADITVNQRGLGLGVSPDTLSFVATGETKYVTLTNIPQAALVYNVPAWISVNLVGSTLYLTASENNTGLTRTETVRVSESGKPTNYVEISVSQESTPQFVANPSTVSFNPAGDKVYVEILNVPSGATVYATTYPDWVTVDSITSNTFYLNVFANTGSYVSGQVVFKAGNKECYVDISQGVYGNITVSPKEWNLTSASAATSTFSVSNVPAAGLSVYAAGAYWLSSFFDASNALLFISASSNASASKRTADFYVYESGRSNMYSNCDTIIIRQPAKDLGQLMTTPDDITFPPEGGVETATIINLPAGGASVVAIPWWFEQGSVTISGDEVSITAPVNKANNGNTSVVRIRDNNDSSNYCTISIHQRKNYNLDPVSSNILFQKQGETKIVTFNTIPIGGDIRYQDQPDWITVTGDATNGFILTASENTNTGERTGTIRFFDNNYSSNRADVTLVQEGTGIFSVSPSSLTFIQSGETKNVTLLNIPVAGYSIEKPLWVETDVVSLDTISITVEPNITASQRTGTVRFVDNNDNTRYCDVSITQEYGLVAVPTNIVFYTGGGYQDITLYNVTGPITAGIPQWVTLLKLSDTSYRISVGGYTGGQPRTADIYFEEDNNTSNRCQVLLTQYGGAEGAITVSPSYLTFPAQGEETKIAVISNIPINGMRFEGLEEWCNISIEGDTITCAPYANDSAISRSTIIKIIDKSNNSNFAQLYISQERYAGSTMVISRDIQGPLSIPKDTGGTVYTYTLVSVPVGGVRVVTTKPGINAVVSGTKLIITADTAQEEVAGMVVVYDASDNSNYVPINVYKHNVSGYTYSVKCDQMPMSSISDSCAYLGFETVGGTQKIFIWNGPLDETVTITAPSWITYSISGNVMTVTVGENVLPGYNESLDATTRSGYIRISGYDINNNYVSLDIPVYQCGKNDYTVTPHLYTIPGNGGRKEIQLGNAYPIDYPQLINVSVHSLDRTPADWVSAYLSGSKVIIDVDNNQSHKIRMAEVSVSEQHIGPTIGPGSDSTIIYQLYSTKMTIANDEMSFVADGETKTLSISNMNGEVNYMYPKWVSVTFNSRNLSVTASPNTSSYPRGGIISITSVDDPNDFIYIYLNQEGGSTIGEGILPIWMDLNYLPIDVVQDVDYLYHITGNGLDFYGLSVAASTNGGPAYPGPVNIARIVESYLTSSADNVFNGLPEQWNTLGTVYDVSFYHTAGNQDVLVDEFSFWNDWSGYKKTYNYTQTLNDPINKKGCQNMILPFCVYCNTNSNFSIVTKSGSSNNIIELGTPLEDFSICSDIYSGVDKVSFMKDNNILFSYDMTYCGDGYFVYRNRFGGWDSFLIEGNIKKSEGYEKEHFTTNGVNSSSDTWEKRTDKTSITTTYEAVTGWLTDQEADRLVYHLLSSPEVYFNELYLESHRLTPDKMISVNITNTTTEYKKFKIGKKLIRYTITFEESKTKQVQR